MWKIKDRAELFESGFEYEGKLEDKGPKPFVWLSRGQFLALRDFTNERAPDIASIEDVRSSTKAPATSLCTSSTSGAGLLN